MDKSKGLQYTDLYNKACDRGYIVAHTGEVDLKRVVYTIIKLKDRLYDMNNTRIG